MKGMLGSIKLKILTALIGCFFWAGIQTACAAEINVNITGEIYIPPCKINGNDTDIIVSFDNMSPYEVDGLKNAVTKTIAISCYFYQGTPYIRMDGTVLPGAGDNVLNTTGTNSSSLGIALYQGADVNASYPLRIGAGEQGEFGYKVTRGLTGQNTANGQFTFTAVPYKSGSGTLSAGAFSATATMTLNYL
ncbi:fimbrial protein [Escherichia coli]|uniref:fimbrial protein n=1 Tax=Escherichia coli TaxID=562 RepID=UPI003A8CF077